MNQKIYDVHQLWTMFVNNKKWFALSLFLCLCLGVSYIYFVKPAFLVTGKLLIIEKKRDASAISASVLLQSQLPYGLGSSLAGSIGVENEKEILKSRLLARDIVTDLGLYTEYRIHKFLKSPLLYKTQPINVSVGEEDLQRLDKEQPMVYHQLNLKIYKDKDGYRVEGKLIENKKKFDLPEQGFKALPAVIKTSIGNITLTENTQLSNKLKKQYQEDDYRLDVTILPPITAAIKLAKRVSITPATKKATSVVVIGMKDESSIRGIDYINSLADHYNKQTNDERQKEAAKNDEFVRERMAIIDAELGTTDADWENFKQQFQVTDPKADAEEVLKMKGGYEGQLVNLGTQLLLLDYLSEYVNSPKNLYELIPVNVGVYSGDAVSLISQHNELVNNRNILMKSFTEQAPQVKQATDYIKELHPVIKTALERDRQSLLLKRDVVKKEFDRYQSRITNVPQQERALTEVGRLRNIKQGVYLSLLQKREENAMELVNNTDKGRLIDATLFNKKVRPRTMIVLLLSLLMGMLMPFIIFFLRSWLRGTIGTYDDLISMTSLPVIGVIPEEGHLSDETFRTLRTRLLLQMNNQEKVVLLTSYASGDGKTYVATRLAESLSYIGKRVIVCDVNFRHPSLAEAVGIPHGRGICDLLSEDAPLDIRSLSELIRPCPSKGYDVLLSGNLHTAHPADLLGHKGIPEIIALLREKYDVVILDSAAVGEYSDVLEIAGQADLTCYVCLSGKTPKTSVMKLSDGLLPIPQLILNRVEMKTKKSLKQYMALLLLPLLLSACGSSKDVAYLQNMESVALNQSGVLYDARIMPKDILTITVNTINPTAAQPFNLSVSSTMSSSNMSLTSQPTLQTYLVDNDGNINFPIVGVVKVGGLTKSEAEQMLRSKILPYMSETEKPIVTVRMSSFSISVLGEVSKPGYFTVSREKINVLEALASAGDMTIYGIRDRVKLIREDATGKKEMHTLNLNDANIVNSPYYYLQQNDILYVEPNKAKAQNSSIGNMTSIWFSVTGIALSVATLLISIFK